MALFGLLPQGAPAIANAGMVQQGILPPAPPQPDPYEQPSGLFGIKGTARDILGTLGDAMLTQAGHKRVYAPQRQQERVAEAMHGSAQDPQGALERLRKIDPAAAQRMEQQMFERGVAEAKARRENIELGYKGDKNTRDQGIYEDKVTQAGFQLLGTANEQTYPMIKERVNKHFEARGVKNPFTLPDTYDKANIDNLLMGGISAVDQERLADKGIDQDLRRQDLDIDRQALGIRREANDLRRDNNDIRRDDVNRDNDRADGREEERRRRNRVTERQRDYSNETQRNRSTSGGRRKAPTTRYVRQNGVLFDTKTGLPVK